MVARNLRFKASKAAPPSRQPMTESPAPDNTRSATRQPLCQMIGIPCPKCNSTNTPVKYTRPRGRTRRRVRRCLDCQAQFCTTESVV